MITMTSSIKQWLKNFRKYLFYYRNGFFELPYLANSPQTMIESLHSMPFIKSNNEERSIISNTPFLKGDLRYYDVEDGLFVHASVMDFKANVNFKLIYDKDLPVEHYYLTLHINQLSLKSKDPIIGGLPWTDRSWTLFKPDISNAKHDVCHFKGAHGVFITVYFTEKWLLKYLDKVSGPIAKELKSFINSDRKYIMWPEVDDSDFFDYAPLWKAINQGETPSTIKQHTETFISFFADKVLQEKVSENHLELNNNDRIKVMKVSKILADNLLNEFPGIESLAQEVSISETKLKSIFKQLTGQTLYQYHLSKQMQLAKTILENENLPIAEVGTRLYYASPSKFTEAFKKHFGYLPSEVRNKM